jgi:hypothetical protein
VIIDQDSKIEKTTEREDTKLLIDCSEDRDSISDDESEANKYISQFKLLQGVPRQGSLRTIEKLKELSK